MDALDGIGVKGWPNTPECQDAEGGDRALTATGTASTSGARRQPLSGAYFWVAVFLALYCVRPEDWIPGLHIVPLKKIVGGFAILAFLLMLGQARRRLPRETLYLILLFVQLCLTVPFSPVWRGGAFWHVADFTKVVLIVLVMAVAVSTMYRLRVLILLQSLSVAVVAAVTMAKGRQLPGGRLEGSLSGNYSNPNDLALSIVLVLPFAFVFLLRTQSAVRKVLWGLAILVMAGTIFLTGSRAGFFAAVVATGLCLWDFAIKGRRYHLVVLVGIASVALLVLVGDRLMERLSSTWEPGEDQVAYASAEARRELFWRSLEVTAEHPLLGVGPGNFTSISGSWRTQHNTYTQLSSEGGVPALILFLLIILRAFANIRWVRRQAVGRAEETFFAMALRTSLVSFLVGAAFASLAYQFFPYFLVAYTTSLESIARGESDSAPATQLKWERASSVRVYG